MRFMIIVKANRDAEAGVMPSEAPHCQNGGLPGELQNAGVLLDASGLQPSLKGWGIKYSAEKRTVIDGPFTEAKELIAGYALIQVKSREEAMEWAKGCPNPALNGKEGEIEIRQLFELGDFGPSEAVERFRVMEEELPKKRYLTRHLSMAVSSSHTCRVIDAVWRIESAKLIAGLARIVRDVGRPKSSRRTLWSPPFEQWPESGVPENPGACLMATAKHRAIDRLRRIKLIERKHEELGRDREIQREAALQDLYSAMNDEICDDFLRFIFTACHPVPSTEARVALTLRLPGGLTTQEIARAFLIPEPTRRPAHRPGPSGHCRRRVFPSRSRAEPTLPLVLRRCSRLSTSSSTGLHGSRR